VSNEPRTKAGRELLADLEPRFANLPWDPISYDLTREQVLAIEAEAERSAGAAPIDVKQACPVDGCDELPEDHRHPALTLDVDRLAIAIYDAFAPHVAMTDPAWHREIANRIAAEYTRLLDATPPDPPLPITPYRRFNANVGPLPPADGEEPA